MFWSWLIRQFIQAGSWCGCRASFMSRPSRPPLLVALVFSLAGLRGAVRAGQVIEPLQGLARDQLAW